MRKALIAAWVIISLMLIPAVAAPLVAPETAVSALLPQCWSIRAAGRPCFFCGITRGFFAIGRGDFAGAMGANAGAIPLYAALGLNEAVLFSAAARMAYNRLRGG